MKKDETYAPGIAVHPPAMGDYVLPRADFEAKAADFLNKQISSSVFIELCDLALDNAFGDADYARLIHKYRYLAYMAEENYIEALKDADVMLSYADELIHYQMRCTVNLRRNNYRNALEYLDKIIVGMTEKGLDVEALEVERASLAKFVSKIQYYCAEDFCLEFYGDPKEGLRKFAGVPLILTGVVRYILHYESRIPYLIFEVNQGKMRRIYCQAPRSELPFVTHLKVPQNAQVFGYVLLADLGQIVIQPCNLIT